MSDGDRRPALRAADADREATVELLRRAAGDGRIDLAELDDRVTGAYAARTIVELQALTADLTSLAPRAPAGVLVRPGPGGTRSIVSIMSGQEREGRWRLAARCLVLCVMGGARLDLANVELAAETTEIRVVSIMGGAEVRVPPGLDVEVSRFAVMGGHDVRLPDAAPPPGAPVLRLRLVSIMGGHTVRPSGSTRGLPRR